MSFSTILYIVFIYFNQSSSQRNANIFLGFWDVDYVSHLPYVWYYVGAKSRFQHARGNASPRRPMLVVVGGSGEV